MWKVKIFVAISLVTYSKAVLKLVQFEAKDSGIGHTHAKKVVQALELNSELPTTRQRLGMNVWVSFAIF